MSGRIFGVQKYLGLKQRMGYPDAHWVTFRIWATVLKT